MPIKSSSEKKKKRAKIPEKKSLSNSVESVKGIGEGNRVISKALEKKTTTSSAFLETTELGKSVEKKKEKGFLKWAIGGALGILGFTTGKEVLDSKSQEKITNTVSRTLADEKKLKEINDAAIKTKKGIHTHKKNIEKFEKVLGIKLKGNWEEKTDQYRKDEYGMKELFIDSWKKSAFKDEEKTKKRSWIGRAFTFIPVFFMEYKFYKKVKDWKKSGLLKKLDIFKSSTEKVKQTTKKVGKAIQAAEKAQKTVLTQLRTNKEIQYLRKKKTKLLVNEYKKNISQVTKDLQYKKISGKKYGKSLQKTITTLFQKVKKNGSQREFLRLIKAKKIPGISLSQKASKVLKWSSGVPIGRIGIASAINISIFEAVREGSFGTFFKSVTSKKTLMEAFIPGVGIHNSIKRAKTNNDPLWLKGLDIGVNALADGFMAVGLIGGIFTGGASAAAAYAAKGSLISVARGWTSKKSLKYAAKKAVKIGKSSAKLSLITSPLTLAIALAAKSIDHKAIQESFKKNILSSEQQRSFVISNS